MATQGITGNAQEPGVSAFNPSDIPSGMGYERIPTARSFPGAACLRPTDLLTYKAAPLQRHGIVAFPTLSRVPGLVARSRRSRALAA
ncbi:MAG: hypothetical protein JO333_19755 [Verrucomicrobia bacterium]|nr:hypothetical protein [Verrucomicrobiota bacterium]